MEKFHGLDTHCLGDRISNDEFWNIWEVEELESRLHPCRFMGFPVPPFYSTIFRHAVLLSSACVNCHAFAHHRCDNSSAPPSVDMLWTCWHRPWGFCCTIRNMACLIKCQAWYLQFQNDELETSDIHKCTVSRCEWNRIRWLHDFKANKRWFMIAQIQTIWLCTCLRTICLIKSVRRQEAMAISQVNIHVSATFLFLYFPVLVGVETQCA